MNGLSTILGTSGLFEPTWYRARYPDVGASSDAFDHFVRQGLAGERWPNPMFDPVFYRASSMEGAAAKPALLHYIEHGIAADRDPHPLFEAGRYRQAYMAMPGLEGLSPTVHYRRIGTTSGNRPNRFFDPTFYRTAYPDTAHSGVEPLEHFSAFGESEGRRPAIEVDLSTARSDSVVNRVPPRPGTLADLLRGATGGWSPEIVTRVQADPGGTLKAALDAIDEQFPTTMIVSHRWGGGVFRAIDQHVREVVARSNLLLVIGIAPYLFLTVRGPREQVRLAADTRSDLAPLRELLKRLCISRTQIHHVMDVPALPEIVGMAGAPVELMLHDYYLLSPQPHLVDRNGRFVGEDLALHGSELIAASAQPDLPSLRSWQRGHRWLIEKAAHLKAPSYDVARRFHRRYGDLAIEVQPLEIIEPADPVPSASTGPVTAVVLGDLARHKGYDVVASVAHLAIAQKRAVRFVLIGHSMDDAGLRNIGVEVTGAYHDSDLPCLIAEHDPDVIWFPAQCPETFSYTLSAALRCGRRILASRLGAFPERLAHVGQATMIPWDAAADVWLQAISEQRQPKRAPTRG